MLGQVPLHQTGQAGQVAHLLDLHGIEEGAEAVGQVQGVPGVYPVPLQQVGVVADQPGQLEPAAQRADRRRQVHGQVAGLEGRLALVQVPQGADLRQKGRLAMGRADKGLRQRPHAPPGGGQNNGVGQGLGPDGGQDLHQPPGQVVDERPVGGNVEPSRPGTAEHPGEGRLGEGQVPGGGVRPAGHWRSRASAASRAAGSPTCIHWPSSTRPYSRPARAISPQMCGIRLNRPGGWA